MTAPPTGRAHESANADRPARPTPTGEAGASAPDLAGQQGIAPPAAEDGPQRPRSRAPGDASERGGSTPRHQLLGWIALAALGALLWSGVLPALWEAWQEDTRPWFGSAVLMVGVAHLWLRRKDLRPRGGAHPWALGLVAPAVALYLAASLADELWLKVLGLLGMTAGMAGYLGGRRALWASLGPLGSLLFMIPWPSWLSEPAAFALQVTGSTYGSMLAGLMGVHLVRDGVVVWIAPQAGGAPAFSIMMAQECSPLMGILRLMWLAYLLAYHTPVRWGWRAAMVAAMFPLGAAASALRMGVILTAGGYVGLTAAMRLHDHESSVRLFLCSLILVALRQALVAWPRARQTESLASGEASRAEPRASGASAPEPDPNGSPEMGACPGPEEAPHPLPSPAPGGRGGADVTPSQERGRWHRTAPRPRSLSHLWGPRGGPSAGEASPSSAVPMAVGDVPSAGAQDDGPTGGDGSSFDGVERRMSSSAQPGPGWQMGLAVGILLLAWVGGLWAARVEATPTLVPGTVASLPAGRSASRPTDLAASLVGRLDLPFRGWAVAEPQLTKLPPRERREGVLMRRYQSPDGEAVELLVMAGTRRSELDTRRHMLRGGLEAIDVRPHTLSVPRPLHPSSFILHPSLVRSLMSGAESGPVVATHCFTDGRAVVSSLSQLQARQLLARLRGRTPVGAFVRVLVPARKGDVAAAARLSDDFCRAVLPPLMKALREADNRW